MVRGERNADIADTANIGNKKVLQGGIACRPVASSFAKATEDTLAKADPAAEPPVC
jgi:hypothetical protein